MEPVRPEEAACNLSSEWAEARVKLGLPKMEPVKSERVALESHPLLCVGPGWPKVEAERPERGAMGSFRLL